MNSADQTISNASSEPFEPDDVYPVGRGDREIERAGIAIGSVWMERPQPTSRIQSIDFLRGCAMVAMAIDHTRDYFSRLPFEPEDLQRTWAALFATRWITHFCAPLFFFLAGTGAYLYGRRHTPAELRRFLWSRGLWLMVLEFTLVGFAWTFIAPWGFFGVIFCLGFSMVLLSQIVRLPLRWIAVAGAAVVALHDLLDGIRPARFGSLAWLWSILHVKGGIVIFGFHKFVLFPIVPWFAVMMLGYAFGALLERPDRRRWMVRLGLAMTAAFIVLRATNLYGNPPALPGGVTPGDWAPQPTVEKSVILFLDTEKYPPSIQFLFMTMGPSLLVLSLLDGRRLTGLARPIVLFGRVPLFFYVAHLYLIHVLAVVVAALCGQPVGWLLHGAFWKHDIPPGYGHDLPFVYAIWALTLILLYFPCRWFADLKSRRRSPWLSYL